MQYGPGFNSASNRYEYQGYLLGGKGGRCVGPTTLPPSCADSLKILGPSTSWSPEGLSRPVVGIALPFVVFFMLPKYKGQHDLWDCEGKQLCDFCLPLLMCATSVTPDSCCVYHSGLPLNYLELSTVPLFSKERESPRKWEHKKTVKSFVDIKCHNYRKCTNTV